MNCRTFRNRLQDFFDKTLEDNVVQEMEQHIAFCQDCAEWRQQWRRMSAVAKTLPRVDAPPDFEIRLRNRLRKECSSLRFAWLPFPQMTFRFAAYSILFLMVGLAGLFLYNREETGEIAVVPNLEEQPFISNSLPGNRTMAGENVAYPVTVPTSDRMADYMPTSVNGDWPPDIQVRGENGEYVEYLLKGTGPDEILVRMPKTIRVKPPGENDPSYFRYISH